MATREQFRLQTDMCFEPDNPAVEAICLVVEDNFGKGTIQTVTGDDGNLHAHVRIQADSPDARLVNWLHGKLASVSKYLLAPADVDCADATGREQGYRLEPAPIAGAGEAASPPPDDGAAAPA